MLLCIIPRTVTNLPRYKEIKIFYLYFFRFLAMEATFNQLNLDFLVGKNTIISVIIKDTLTVLWKTLQPLKRPELTKETWL